jgi:hypothetical protein
VADPRNLQLNTRILVPDGDTFFGGPFLLHLIQQPIVVRIYQDFWPRTYRMRVSTRVWVAQPTPQKVRLRANNLPVSDVVGSSSPRIGSGSAATICA